MGRKAARQDTPTQARPEIPGVASLTASPERIKRMWRMTAQQRVEAAQRGEFTLGEMLQWARRRPAEVPLVDNEFFFITAFSADADVGND